MPAKHYRKKPVEIEAWQVNSLDYDEMCDIVKWCGGRAIDENGRVIEIDTLEGTMLVSPGNYVIKDVHGEFYPCKPEIFDASYEAVD